MDPTDALSQVQQSWRRLSAQPWFARLWPRLPHIAALVLAVALAHNLAQITWKLIPGPADEDIWSAVDALPPAARPEPNTPAFDVRAIADLHLFGEATEAPVASAPIDAPETKLNLVLRGLIASDDPAEARAIIVIQNGQEKPFKVGDRIDGRVTLKEIYADRVILDRGGRLETLRLPKEPAVGNTRSASGRSSTPAPATVSDGSLLEDVRQRLQEDPQSILQMVRIVPHQEGETFKGFRVFPGKDPALLRRVGLRPGDLVTAVNGIVLDNPAKGAEALQNLQNSGSVNLTVERAGKQINVTVQP